VKRCAAGVLAAAAAATAGVAARRVTDDDRVWQLDPEKCTQCGRCATSCVLKPSAVKCVHAYDVCGYCELCGGYHQPNVRVTDTAAENQLCPTAAIKRTFIEDPYYEYTIIEDLCIGCAKCVKGCTSFGNCNECAIARDCPARAFRRVPASRPYILKGGQAGGNPPA
jgi:electron transport complex protein RnfB